MHCSPPQHEEGARKGALNIACFTSSYPAYRSWREPYLCGETTKSKTKGQGHKDTNKRTRIIPLTLGAWNVRTLLDRENVQRPERRTAIVGMELARYNIDIAALSETRFPGVGKLCEKGSGYTFYWSGRDPGERREAGVGFAV